LSVIVNEQPLLVTIILQRADIKHIHAMLSENLGTLILGNIGVIILLQTHPSD